jgi:hypothetical protein
MMAVELLVQVKLELPVRTEAAEEICSLFLHWLEEEGFKLESTLTVGDDRGYAELARDFVSEWKARTP